MTQLLLLHGSGVDTPYHGLTPLDFSLHTQQPDITDLLVSIGAKTEGGRAPQSCLPDTAPLQTVVTEEEKAPENCILDSILTDKRERLSRQDEIPQSQKSSRQLPRQGCYHYTEGVS